MFSRKTTIILFSALFAGVFVALFFSLNNAGLSDNMELPQVKESELEKDEYNKVRDELIMMLRSEGARAALEELSERIERDHAVLRSCHSLAHELGHEAYELHGDFAVALQYKDEMCNSGYLHGVIESHFSKSGDIFTTMNNVCDAYPIGKFLSWECFHGVGHGVMYYSANDLPKSLSLCESYKNSFSRSSCVNGVFMENFNTEQKDHISKYLNPEDPFYPCQEQKMEYQDDCFIYAPTYYLSLYRNDYGGALEWCEGAPQEHVPTCVHGVGSQVMKENIYDPLMVEQMCFRAGGDLKMACIRGMIGLYINHFGSLEEAQALCPKLTEENRGVCLEEIKLRSYMF